MTNSDPNLTAYALGELGSEAHSSTRAEIEVYLSTHPDARQFVEDARAIAALLSDVLQREPSPGLGDDRVAALLVEAETVPTLRLHDEDPSADEFSDDPHGTPVYHVITHPTAGPQHWRRTLITVAAAVAIVASALTAIISSMLRASSNRGPVAAATPEAPDRGPIIFTLRDRDETASDPFAVPGFPNTLAKTPQEMLASPELSSDPQFAIGPVIVTPLKHPRPTTRESSPGGGAYAVSLENPFVDVMQSPLSALPLHTGRASYAAVKRAIEAGHLPAKEAVRVEELVNYFLYDYAAPSGEDTFAANLETAACPWDESHRLVRIGLKAKNGAADEIVAKAATMQVEFNPATVAAYRLIGFDRRLSTRSESSSGADGDVAAAHAITALYEVIPAKAGGAGNRAALKYQGIAGLTEAAKSGELLTVTVKYRDPKGGRREQAFAARDGGGGYQAASTDFRFAAATAAFGMVLRESPHKGSATFDTVLALVAPALRPEDFGVRGEFVELVKKAKAIKA